MPFHRPGHIDCETVELTDFDLDLTVRGRERFGLWHRQREYAVVKPGKRALGIGVFWHGDRALKPSVGTLQPVAPVLFVANILLFYSSNDYHTIRNTHFYLSPINTGEFHRDAQDWTLINNVDAWLEMGRAKIPKPSVKRCASRQRIKKKVFECSPLLAPEQPEKVGE
ncbi:conserved hypothetical protein [Paraburkholderia tropica]|nr:conserved hypothetical protein [Paraburkholderia tropica]